MSDLLIALGGNAFARPPAPLTMAGQLAFAEATAAQLIPEIADVERLLFVHGNGPQVGQMLVRVEAALGQAYPLTLDVCVAESEGELGYVLVQALGNAWRAHGVPREICSLLTQVVVDAEDPAFAEPVKPIGRFLSGAEAARLVDAGMAVREDAGGRGWRRVVCSPAPREVVELPILARLVDAGVVVVAAGGGGIPVVAHAGRLEGVEAVIDKDATAALLADALGFSTLALLTDVPCAYLGFRTPTQRPLGAIAASALAAHARDGHFAAGSMGPKVAAACAFVTQPGRRAILCAPENFAAALAGRDGTRVTFDCDLGILGSE